MMSDHGTDFLNETINGLTKTFYGTVEAFNKVLENTLTKACKSQRSDWDLRILVVLRSYWMTCMKLTGQEPFRFVYGVEVVMPMEYIVPSVGKFNCLNCFH